MDGSTAADGLPGLLAVDLRYGHWNEIAGCCAAPRVDSRVFESTSPQIKCKSVTGCHERFGRARDFQKSTDCFGWHPKTWAHTL